VAFLSLWRTCPEGCWDWLPTMVLQNVSLAASHDLHRAAEATSLPVFGRSTLFMARRTSRGHPLARHRGAQDSSAAFVLMPSMPVLVGDRAALSTLAWWGGAFMCGVLVDTSRIRSLLARLLHGLANAVSSDSQELAEPRPKELDAAPCASVPDVAPCTAGPESEDRRAFGLPCYHMAGTSLLSVVATAIVVRRAHIRSKLRVRGTSRERTTRSRNFIEHTTPSRGTSNTLSRQLSIQVATEGGQAMTPTAPRLSKGKDGHTDAIQEVALAGGLDTAVRPLCLRLSCDSESSFAGDMRPKVSEPAMEDSGSACVSSPVSSPSMLSRRRSTGNAGVGSFALAMPTPVPRRSRTNSLPHILEEPSAAEFRRQEPESVEDGLRAYRAMLAARSGPSDDASNEEWDSSRDEEEGSGQEESSPSSRSCSSSSESYSESSDEEPGAET